MISFTFYTVLLTEGLHDVQVKAFGPDGKPIISSTKIRIPAADLSAPVRISYPQKGMTLMHCTDPRGR